MNDLDGLISGYKHFYEEYVNKDINHYKKASKVQAPKSLVIACSDSRVDPAIITNAAPGEIFVIRNVANLVPPYLPEKGDDKKRLLHGVSAALEFAVCILQVRNIIILGHSHCAGIHTIIEPTILKKSDFIGDWMDIARPTLTRAISDFGDVGNSPEKKDLLQQHCSEKVILLSMQNLLTFPWIEERVKAGDLNLHGWYFSIFDGILKNYNQQQQKFTPVL